MPRITIHQRRADTTYLVHRSTFRRFKRKEYGIFYGLKLDRHHSIPFTFKLFKKKIIEIILFIAHYVISISRLHKLDFRSDESVIHMLYVYDCKFQT